MRYLIILLTTIIYHASSAQVACTITYKAFTAGIEHKGKLNISKKNYPFYSEQLTLPDAKKQPEDDRPTISMKDNVTDITITPKWDYNQKNYQIYFKQKDSLITIDYIGDKKVSYYEPLPKIKWEVTKEHKKISNYTCTKAKCNFRERRYDVWFTIDIPVQVGPWKFNGLPGLILQANDESMQYTWDVTTISFTESDEKIVLDKSLPNYSIRNFVTKEKEFREKNIEEKLKVFMAKFQGRGETGGRIVTDKITMVRGRELKYDWE